MTVNRRTVIRTGAWSVPAVAVVAAAPAMAASGGPVAGPASARKCPGQSSHDGETFWTTIVTLNFDQPVQSVVVSQATLHGQVFDNPPVKPDCTSASVWYAVLENDNSSHGGGSVTFSADGNPIQTVAVYEDNHPLHGYPCSGDC